MNKVVKNLQKNQRNTIKDLRVRVNKMKRRIL